MCLSFPQSSIKIVCIDIQGYRTCTCQCVHVHGAEELFWPNDMPLLGPHCPRNVTKRRNPLFMQSPFSTAVLLGGALESSLNPNPSSICKAVPVL